MGSDISGKSGRYNRHESNAVELLPGLRIRQHYERGRRKLIAFRGAAGK